MENNKIDFKRVEIDGKPRQIWRFKCPKCGKEQVLNGETKHLVTIIDGIVTIEPSLKCAYHADLLQKIYERSGTKLPENWREHACDWSAIVRNGQCHVLNKS